MVGILGPLFSVDLAEGLRHEDAEVGGQVVEGILLQHRHLVGIDQYGVEAGAVLEGIEVYVLQRVGQRDGFQVAATAERVVAQRPDTCELVKVIEPLEFLVVVEDEFYVVALGVLAGEEVSILCQGLHDGIVLKRSYDVLSRAGQVGLVQIVRQL